MSLDIFLFGDSIYTDLIDHLERQSTRSELVAGNLANVETPGYKARDLDFKQILSERQQNGKIGMAVTDEKHFGASSTEEVLKTTRTGENSTRTDGNTVDLDEEMGKLASIQLMYEAGLTALSRKLSVISQATNGAD